jgi:hypothetical protein
MAGADLDCYTSGGFADRERTKSILIVSTNVGRFASPTFLFLPGTGEVRM